jgi:trypsin
MAAAVAGAPEIVGGNNVQYSLFRSHFRWMASLQYTGFGHYCGATLIRSNLAMTAAHCVEGMQPDELTLLHGTRLLSSGGTQIGIVSIHMHPEYDRRTLDHDIALLRLAAPVSGPLVTPATMASTSDIAGPGRMVQALGWGRLYEGGPFPDVLQSVHVPIISLDRCRASYPSFLVSARMICAGLAGRDSCQGDSGGPLAVQDESGTWQQVGITSWGVGCARQNQPGVYARVGRFTHFIAQVTQGLGAACYDPTWPAHFRTPEQFECNSFTGFDDNSTGPVRIGFPVRLGDLRFNELFINTNGNVTFGSSLFAWMPATLSQIPMPIIAPYWDDVDTRYGGEIRYGRAIIDGKRAFMVIWNRVPRYAGPTSSVNTFQLVLMEPDPTRRWLDIEFNYARIDWNYRGAYVGFSLALGGPGRQRAGAGDPASYVDSARNALVRASSPGSNVPGRLTWQLRAGQTIR